MKFGEKQSENFKISANSIWEVQLMKRLKVHLHTWASYVYLHKGLEFLRYENGRFLLI